MSKPYSRTWTTKAGVLSKAWMVEFRDANGERKRKQFKKKKRADEFADALIRNGGPHCSSTTVAQGAIRFLEVCQGKGRGENGPVCTSTYDHYQTQIERHLLPLIGSRVMSSFSVGDARTFQLDLNKSGLSRSMIKRVFDRAKNIFDEAVGYDINVSPFAGLRQPEGRRNKRKNIVIPLLEEVHLILAMCEQMASRPRYQLQASAAWRRYEPLVKTIVFTGARISELLGLPWSAIDFDKLQIRIFQRADSDLKIGEPKSEAGYRTIDIPPELADSLRKWKEFCPSSPLDLVFPNGAGNVDSYQNVRKRCWIPLLEACGLLRRGERNATGGWVEDKKPLPKFGFHPFRHLQNSLMMHFGASLKEMMARAGHSSLAAAEIYVHLLKDPQFATERSDLSGRVAEIIRGKIAEEDDDDIED